MEPRDEGNHDSPNDWAFPDIVDDTERDDALEAYRAAELDGLKIRQLSSLRRGAIRARSWCLIAAGVGAVGAVQLVIKAVRNIRHAHALTLRAVGFLLFAVVGTLLAIALLRRAAALKREVGKSSLPAPVTPPDFSTLNDGSERWKDLEDMR